MIRRTKAESAVLSAIATMPGGATIGHRVGGEYPKQAKVTLAQVADYLEKLRAQLKRHYAEADETARELAQLKRDIVGVGNILNLAMDSADRRPEHEEVLDD